VYRVPGLHRGHQLLRVAIDDRALTDVSENDAEVVVDVALVLGLLRPLRNRNHQLVGLHHLLESHFRGNGGGQLHELGHQRSFFGGELSGAAPAWHAGVGAVEDHLLELVECLLGHLARGDVGTGCALAERTVATRTAIEVDICGGILLLLAQLGYRRCGAGSDEHHGERRKNDCEQGRAPTEDVSTVPCYPAFLERSIEPPHLYFSFLIERSSAHTDQLSRSGNRKPMLAFALKVPTRILGQPNSSPRALGIARRYVPDRSKHRARKSRDHSGVRSQALRRRVVRTGASSRSVGARPRCSLRLSELSLT